MNAVNTVLDVHTRIADLYSSPHNQIHEQLRLTIETIKERQESELINNAEYGLLNNVAKAQVVHPVKGGTGAPTPDDLDELISRVWKEPAFFLAHPQTIAAFGREATYRGVPPVIATLFGSQFLTWRGLPLIPSDKVRIVNGKSKILLLRTGENRQGVAGLYQPNLTGELSRGLSVRFMGINHKAIASYLISLYCSLAVLTDDALGCSRMSKWASTMNTSEFDQYNPSQHDFTENSGIASLPDIDHLTKLANELFTALPCDGSRLGIAAAVVPGGLSSPLAGLDKAGVTASAPQASGVPGEAELRQLFAPRQPSFESVPDSIDTGPVFANTTSAGTPDFTSPLAGLDQAVLAGILPHDFGLPGETELQQLLVSRTPSGSHMPRGFDVDSFPDSPASVTTQEATAEALAASDKSEEATISPQVLEAELQKLFAADTAATGRIPKSAAGGSIPGIPASPPAPGLTGSLSNVEASLPVVPSSQAYGLPGEAELKKLQAVQPTSGSIIPARVDASSIPAIPSSVARQELAVEALADADKSAEADISPQVFEAELQKLFAANTAATGKIPNSAASSSIPGFPSSTATPGLTGSLADLDASLIAGLSPEVYGLPGEAELLKFSLRFLRLPGIFQQASARVRHFIFLMN